MRRLSLMLPLVCALGCRTPIQAPRPGPFGATEEEMLAARSRPRRNPHRDGWAWEIGRLADPLIENEWAVGLSIGLVHERKAWFHGYGRTAASTLPVEAGPVPDEATIFPIGSVSKVFTGILLAEAERRGLVDADVSIDELLSSPVAARPAPTLRQLASHTSGYPRMPVDFAPEDPTDPYADYGRQELAASLERTRLAGAQGSYAYSNFGMGLLGSLLAARTGQSYGALVEEWIAEPLDLPDTRQELTVEQRFRLAAGHAASGLPAPHWRFDALAGAGGLYASTQDLVHLAAASLAAPGMEQGDDLLGALAAAQEPVGEDGQTALGWHLLSGEPGVRWHNGQTAAAHSFIALDHETGVAVVVLANSAQMRIDEFGWALLSLVRGEEEVEFSLPGRVELPSEQLDALAGRYLLDGSALELIREGDMLFARFTGQRAVRVWPASANLLRYREVEAELEVQRDRSGAVTGLVLVQDGHRHELRRG